MTKVLVTGGCGFIGSALVNDLLARGYQVHVVDNLSLGRNHWDGKSPAPVLHVQDILDGAGLHVVLADVCPAIVFHMAAHHYIPLCENDPYEAYRLNVAGTLEVLEACRRAAVKKFFFASTGDVYPPSSVPHREIDMVSPIYVYGHTKYLAEQICIKYFETKMQDAALIIGRIFNAAGPRETNPHLIPDVVRQMVDGKKVIEVGNLWPKRDFVDVHSMAQVIGNLTLAATGIEVVNIGSGRVQEIGEVLATLKAAACDDIEIVSVPGRQRANDRPFLCPDTSRLLRLNGSAARSFSVETAQVIFEYEKTRNSSQ